jgi:hypothetical protein
VQDISPCDVEVRASKSSGALKIEIVQRSVALPSGATTGECVTADPMASIALRSLKSAAAACGGTVDVSSTSDGGSVIQILI